MMNLFFRPCKEAFDTVCVPTENTKSSDESETQQQPSSSVVSQRGSKSDKSKARKHHRLLRKVVSENVSSVEDHRQAVIVAKDEYVHALMSAGEEGMQKWMAIKAQQHSLSKHTFSWLQLSSNLLVSLCIQKICLVLRLRTF